MLLKKKAPKSWAVFNKWKSLDCALPCCKVYHCREGITQEEGGVSSYVPGYIICKWFLKSKAWLRVFCCDTNNWLQRNLCYLSRYQDTKCHFFTNSFDVMKVTLQTVHLVESEVKKKEEKLPNENWGKARWWAPSFCATHSFL